MAKPTVATRDSKTMDMPLHSLWKKDGRGSAAVAAETFGVIIVSFLP
jgi:hypothetical protein